MNPCNRRMPYFVTFWLPAGGESRAYKTRMVIRFLKKCNTSIRELLYFFSFPDLMPNSDCFLWGLDFNALGAAEPEYRIRLFGEGCLSGASSRAILIRDGGGGTPMGPCTGGNGFGNFCRNKSASSRGRESPHLIILESYNFLNTW